MLLTFQKGKTIEVKPFTSTDRKMNGRNMGLGIINKMLTTE
jgi:hypothetical protein